MRSGARSESMIASAQRNSSRRKSLSEISIPLSALVAPHAPSVSVRSSMYHMRDPRKPPRIHPTPWSLELRNPDQEGSPVHAWFFFIGFVLFPLWYVASFWRIPQTRQVGGSDTEKAVTLDDPQVEHGECPLCRPRTRLKAILHRRAVVAAALSHYVRGIALDLHSLHRLGRHLRPSQLISFVRDKSTPPLLRSAPYSPALLEPRSPCITHSPSSCHSLEQSWLIVSQSDPMRLCEILYIPSSDMLCSRYMSEVKLIPVVSGFHVSTEGSSTYPRCQW